MDGKRVGKKQGINTEGMDSSEEGGQGFQDQFRVVINKDAHQALMTLVDRMNDGFDGGKIAKSDVVNWMLLHSAKFVTEADVKTLRSAHFDEKKILGSLLKNVGEQGALPEGIKKALRDYYGISEGGKKRSSGAAQRSPVEKSSDIEAVA